MVNLRDNVVEELTRICEQICNDYPVALTIFVQISGNGHQSC